MMSEKEKMLSGELYNASDPQLFSERAKTKELLQSLNNADILESENYHKIIKQLLPNSDPGISIQTPFFCDYGYNIYAGKNVFFNFNCVLLDVAEIIIGSNTLFGPNVQIYTATHPKNSLERKKGLEYGKPIKIGEDCWIGGGAILLPGVTIGDRCIIGAGSVVTKDIYDDTTVVGNPAKIVSQQK